MSKFTCNLVGEGGSEAKCFVGVGDPLGIRSYKNMGRVLQPERESSGVSIS